MTSPPLARPDEPAAAPAPRELRRALGLFSATMIVIGAIMGGGIFFTPANVARSLDGDAAILGVWAFGGLVALAGAFTFAELGAMRPKAGGSYVYLRETMGGLPAFLYGWMLLTTIATGAEAAVAVTFANYLGQYVDLSVVGGPVRAAAITIAMLAVLNYVGVRPGAWVQNVLTVAKTSALGLLIVLGAVMWARLADPPPVLGAPTPTGSLWVALAGAFVPVLFSVGGWQNLNMVAGEVRHPARNLPRALALGVVIVVACYLGANAVYLRALGRDGLALSEAVAADAARVIAGDTGATIISIAVMLSILGIVNVILLATPRVFYAMARDGLFFRFAGTVHPRYGTPHRSIVLMALWSLALLFLSGGDVGELLSGVVFADWIFFALAGATIFFYRRQQPDAERPYRVWGYPVLPALFVFVALVGVASAIASAPRASLQGAILLAAGVPAYWIFSMLERRYAPTSAD
ncbi:MAG TPA: amino acid permease [Gemmatimonadaceae bacterium]|nr:amino acid permease [Gemmatimonadaceae bacterium]